MSEDSLVALGLAALCLGTLYWAWRELGAARDGSIAERHRRVSLYYALLLDSFGTAFAVMALARIWPEVHPLVSLPALLPALLAALAVRMHRGFAVWLLARLA